MQSIVWFETSLVSSADWSPDRESRAGKYKNRDTLLSLVVDYLDHFVDDPAQTHIMSNGKPQSS